AALIAGQGIDQAALTNVGRACHHHAPRHRQMTADTNLANQTLEKTRTSCLIAALPAGKDLLYGLTERALNLIQKNIGGPRRGGVRQGSDRGCAEGLRCRRPLKLLPGAGPTA